MPAHTHRTPSRPIDLTKVTEATRRALYDAAVEDHFTPTPEEIERAAAEPEDFWVPDYGPDEAGLVVYRQQGRWLAAWHRLETGADLPEDRRIALLRIGIDAEGRLQYSEV